MRMSFVFTFIHPVLSVTFLIMGCVALAYADIGTSHPNPYKIKIKSHITYILPCWTNYIFSACSIRNDVIPFIIIEIAQSFTLFLKYLRLDFVKVLSFLLLENVYVNQVFIYRIIHQKFITDLFNYFCIDYFLVFVLLLPIGIESWFLFQWKATYQLEWTKKRKWPTLTTP